MLQGMLTRVIEMGKDPRGPEDLTVGVETLESCIYSFKALCTVDIAVH